MIARYTTAEFRDFWSDKKKFETFLVVELAVLKACEKFKRVPHGTAARIKKKVRVLPERIYDLEKTTKHDVIAFCTSITEQCGAEGAYFHYGLTSSDVVDTALACQLREASQFILEELNALLAALRLMALRYRKLPTIGRTHGVHAEPTSFGLKFLSAFAEFERRRTQLVDAVMAISFGKLSGAVGAYGVLSPQIEAEALRQLGLDVEPVSTQVVPRDRHAQLFLAIAAIGASIERLCVELRHLQRTEVQEIEEGFSKGQKGSSAMPHKKNPISAENLTGLARLLKSYGALALDNVALWHERDISHSSVERMMAPDATSLCHYALRRLTTLIKSLSVRTSNVKKNLGITNRIYASGLVLNALVDQGLSRETAYALVQENAHKAWNTGEDFFQLLWPQVESAGYFKSKRAFFALGDVENYLAHVDTIYKRVLGKNTWARSTSKTKRSVKKIKAGRAR